MFDSRETMGLAPRGLLTLLDLAAGPHLPSWGPSVGSDVPTDDQPEVEQKVDAIRSSVWGPSVGDDVPNDADPPPGDPA